MKRNMCILISAIAFSFSLNAGERYSRLTFGAEWGYMATFHVATHNNFFSDEGYRYNYNTEEFGLWSNGEAYLNIGYNFNEYWNLSLYAGFCGMADIHNAFPVSLRGTRYYGDDPMNDRWFTFVDIGSGVSMKKQPQGIMTGKLGGGYRLSLSRDTKIDITAAMRLSYTHPAIEFENEIIDLEWTNRNDATLVSISFGMAVIF